MDMGLNKDYSMVADSTMASSPRGSVSPEPAPIKHVRRTFGRRKVVADLDASLANTEQSSRDSIYKTGPPDLSEEVPPSDPLKDTESMEGVEAIQLPTKFRYLGSWKTKMKEVDDVDDISTLARSIGSSAQDPGIYPRSPSHVETDVDSPVKFRRSHATGLSKHVLNDSSDQTLSSIPESSQNNDSEAPTTPPATLYRPRTQKNIVLSDDELDHSKESNSRPSTPVTSPPHPIATPKSHTSTSPPTSYHDVSANSNASSATKGKGRATSLVPGAVPPLRLNSHRPKSFDVLEDPKIKPQKAGTSRKEKRQKIKAPTKKEIRETVRERARLAAEQVISIPKADAVEERSVKTFLAKIVAKSSNHVSAKVELPSSPIETFPSSQPGHQEDKEAYDDPFSADVFTSKPTGLIAPSSRLGPSPQRIISDRMQLALGHESDSDDLPDVDSLMNKSKPRDDSNDEVQQSKQRLALLKQQFAAQASASRPYSDDEDSDLEIVPATAIEEQRRSAKKKGLKKGQRMILTNARVKPPIFDPLKSTSQDLELLQEEILRHGTSDPKMLAMLMRKRAEKESMEIIKKKEEQFVKLGGILRKEENGPLGEKHHDEIMQDYLKKGLEAWSKEEKRGDSDIKADEEGSEEDDNWDSEERGSRSPTPCQREDSEYEAIDYEKMELNEDDEAQIPDSVKEEAEIRETDDEAKPVPMIKPKTVTRKLRRLGRVIDSDESDSGDIEITLAKPTHRYLASSSDDKTEDENDKENNTKLMFDRGEDKENKAVARHGVFDDVLSPGPGQPRRSLFGNISDFERDLSMSPPHVMSLEPEPERGQKNEMEGTGAAEKRRPLELIVGESPVSSKLSQKFAEKLQHSSPSRALEDDPFAPPPSTLPASLDLAPVFGADNRGTKSDTEVRPTSGSFSFGAPAQLQPGFSDLFDSTTQKDGSSLQGIKQGQSLGLTQDIALQPAFQIDEKLMQKADAIFEKEQVYVVEAAGKKNAKEQKLYVNDVGLLTQTRPDSSIIRSPSLIFTPTQGLSSGFGLTQTQPQRRPSISSPTLMRPPLRTISLSNPHLSSPEQSPKRRLRKRAETPVMSPKRTLTPRGSPVRSSQLSPTIASRSQPRNAFDILGKRPSDGTRNQKEHDKGKKKGESKLESLVRSEFFEEEAQESDEDEKYFGLKLKKAGDEEEEDGDLDAPLKELVDDRNMDAKTEGADKVLEKHKELLEKDDQEAFDFHNAVVQGELRKKRNRGVGLDDSDDEEDEDERARKIRRKMRERKERGDIKNLAADETTAAFANVYTSALVDDEPIEVRPLDLDSAFLAGREEHVDENDAVMNDGEQGERDDSEEETQRVEEEEEDSTTYITYKEIQAEARRMKEHPEEQLEIRDLEDVSWIDKYDGDGDDMDMDTQTTIVVDDSRGKKGNAIAKSSASLQTGAEFELEFGPGFRKRENEKYLEKSRAWARNEARNLSKTTGRSAGSTAVTGLGGNNKNNKTKNGNGSMRSRATRSSSPNGNKPLKQQPSVLANLSKRNDFE